jgi:hypothetical protein
MKNYRHGHEVNSGVSEENVQIVRIVAIGYNETAIISLDEVEERLR